MVTDFDRASLHDLNLNDRNSNVPLFSCCTYKALPEISPRFDHIAALRYAGHNYLPKFHCKPITRKTSCNQAKP